MIRRFVQKNLNSKLIKRQISKVGNSNITKPNNDIEKPTKEDKEVKKENIKEDIVMMDTKEKVALANEILAAPKTSAKRIKKDKGLIERVETNKIILTEDNKELLND